MHDQRSGIGCIRNAGDGGDDGDDNGDDREEEEEEKGNGCSIGDGANGGDNVNDDSDGVFVPDTNIRLFHEKSNTKTNGTDSARRTRDITAETLIANGKFHLACE